MRAALRWSMAVFALAWLLMGYGCETTKRSDQPQWVQVPITDLSVVEGKWDGLMRRMPTERRDDWVTVTIASNGRYQFTSLRQIGVFSGHGEFVLADGRLKSSSERGTVEAILYEAGGTRMLKAKGRAADGTEYTAEVERVK